jgi:hypothetical protein
MQATFCGSRVAGRRRSVPGVLPLRDTIRKNFPVVTVAVIVATEAPAYVAHIGGFLQAGYRPR